MSLKNGKWRKFWFFTCQLGWPFPLFLSVGDPLSADPDPQYCWMRNQFGSKSTILPVTNNPSVGSSVSLSPISLFLYYLLCRTSAQPWPASWSFLFNFCLRDIQYGGGGIFITFSQWLTRVINRMLQIYWNSPIQRFLIHHPSIFPMLRIRLQDCDNPEPRILYWLKTFQSKNTYDKMFSTTSETLSKT